MKKTILTLAAILIATNLAFPQCQPYIKINGTQVYANQNSETGIVFPVWLNSGSYLAADQMVSAVSVIEFTENAGSLEYSRVLLVSTVQTVPVGKVWKLESVIKIPSFGSGGSVTYSIAGSYTFYVPQCANYICVEVWGGGGAGGGAGSSPSGGGGGGGAYGQGCFSVTPGASYTVTVGAGGTGVTSANGNPGNPSSVGTLISANGGGGGFASGGSGGAGGTSTAPVSIPGGNGSNGSGSCNPPGGAGGNGGAGSAGASCNGGGAGSAPGGGGSGAGTNCCNNPGGAGATGKVKITW